MNTDSTAWSKPINDLISSCRDSEEGFGKAAKGCHSSHLRTFFTDTSAKRSDFAAELAQPLREAGIEPAAQGHGGGILHGGWIDLESRIRPKSDEEFLANCAQGEEATRKHYEHALARELPQEFRAIAERHHREIVETIGQILSLQEQPQLR